MNRSSLLLGPPGVGKTSWAADLALKTDSVLLCIEAAAMNKATDHGIQLEGPMQVIDPGITLFDDLDRVENRDVLLGALSRLNQVEHRRKILILGAVNDLSKLPLALRRPGRFDQIKEFNKPDSVIRDTILRSHLKALDQHLAEMHIQTLVEKTDGMSHADMHEVALQCTVRDVSEILPLIEIMRRMADVEGPDNVKSGQNPPQTTPS